MSATRPRIALVTGATGAIGEAIALSIALTPGFEVVLACRDENKGRRTAARIADATGSAHPRVEAVDLSRSASVAALARRFDGPLHVLVNNAAETPPRRRETADGLEVQLATNVLGYFWMITELREALERGAPSRIVNVASYWAGGLDLTDLQFVRRPYDNDSAYRQSKQADRMLTVAFAERLAPAGISVNACHPGDVSSALSHSLGFGGHETPAQGAETPAWLATSDEITGVTGRYFEHRREKACSFGADRDAVERLYQICQEA